MVWSDFAIGDVPLGGGLLGIAPMPGRSGRYQADLTAILNWGASLVLTMTTAEELEHAGAAALGPDLVSAGTAWRHLPIADFGAPSSDIVSKWPDVSAEAHAVLANGGRVLAHCYGGCGRSGMALLRLMVEAGEDADRALERLRSVRGCAVETQAQRAWAAQPVFDRLGRTR